MNGSNTHNRLAREFVEKVANETGSHAEMMVVIESMVLASMLISQRMYGFAPSACVELVEMAVQQATDRFAGKVGA